MVGLKDCQQQEMEGKLQFHSHLPFSTGYFYTCFQTSWALNKDTILCTLYGTVQSTQKHNLL